MSDTRRYFVTYIDIAPLPPGSTRRKWRVCREDCPTASELVMRPDLDENRRFVYAVYGQHDGPDGLEELFAAIGREQEALFSLDRVEAG